jgi:hypothetical protein
VRWFEWPSAWYDRCAPAPRPRPLSLPKLGDPPANLLINQGVTATSESGNLLSSYPHLCPSVRLSEMPACPYTEIEALRRRLHLAQSLGRGRRSYPERETSQPYLRFTRIPSFYKDACRASYLERLLADAESDSDNRRRHRPIQGPLRVVETD